MFAWIDPLLYVYGVKDIMVAMETSINYQCIVKYMSSYTRSILKGHGLNMASIHMLNAY